ncbi:hypothetical protein AA313_de0209360 [Arthrobotrys entomopaga]|nr:hypothetical protein AA313_de0209360 [Arthrobotrys entomopaga]
MSHLTLEICHSTSFYSGAERGICLSPENKAFLQLSKPHQTSSIVPQYLEQSKIFIESHEPNLSKGPLFNWLPTPELDAADTFQLTQASAATLKHLSVSCWFPRKIYFNLTPRPGVDLPLFGPMIYANVTTLELSFSECYPRRFEEIPRVFPNVVDLVVIEHIYTPEKSRTEMWPAGGNAVYSPLLKLKKLRSARLPWPLVVQEAEMNLVGGRRFSYPVDVIQLRDFTSVWVTPGWIELEKVVYTLWNFDCIGRKFEREMVTFTVGVNAKPKVAMETRSDTFGRDDVDELLDANRMEWRMGGLDEGEIS